MPRTSKGPQLWKRPARRKNGRIVAASVWIIKDGGKHIATGCVADPSGKRPPDEAERALAAYIADKYQPPRKTRDVDVIDIADVLSIYHQDSRARQASPKKFDGRIDRLNEFFGGKMLGESTPRCVPLTSKRAAIPAAGGAILRIYGRRSGITPARTCTTP